jgi:putative transposase
MSRACSPSTGRPYGVVSVCEEWGVARSTVYAAAARGRQAPTLPPAKRGPKTALTDEQLVEHIRRVLGESPFTGEGHRKVWARLRYQGIRTSKARVLRLMREHGLLAPSKATRVLGPRNHDGTIIPEAPDRMWGTDATTTFTSEEGQITVFIAVDHFTAEGVGIHAAKVGNRFEALEPIRQGIRRHFGAYAAGAASGLALRHDHGSQYMSHDFQAEIKFLGIESSPAFVRAPEGNGCAERFIRTLKEQLLWVHTFRTVEELRQALHTWLATYNTQWLIERHGHRSPAQVRRDYFDARQAA